MTADAHATGRTCSKSLSPTSLPDAAARVSVHSTRYYAEFRLWWATERAIGPQRESTKHHD